MKQKSKADQLKSYSQFDVLGNTVKVIDPKGNASTTSYDDRFGSPDAEARNNSAPTGLNGKSSFAFPTSVTNAVGWTTYSQFDYDTGNDVDSEDINGVTTSTFYDDVLDRPTQTISANNLSAHRQQSTIIYDDTNRKVTTTGDLYAFGDNLSKSESFYDEFGRTIEGRTYEVGNEYIVVKTEYDALGRANRSTNPYRPSQNESELWTETTYDALGRKIEVEEPDNTSVLTSYAGNSATVTDQAGKKRRSLTNALGQLIRIDEPNAAGSIGDVTSPTQSTSYEYDTLDNLVEVTQGVQKRYFGYDSLGRLIRVRQPEQDTQSSLNMTIGGLNNTQWTAGFTYDTNGNILTATTANGVVITTTYDQLDRPLTVSYSDGTPTVTNTYDDSAIPFSKGQLTKTANSVSVSEITGLDNLGRVISSRQITDGTNYDSSFQYNLSGMLTQEIYPTGRVVTNTFDNKGDLSKIDGLQGGTNKNYADQLTYASDGRLEKLKVGNGLWEAAKFNNRLQVTEIGLGVSATNLNLWKINLEYGVLNTNGTVDTTKNAGNIAKQTISFNSASQDFVQTYKYDSLDRLIEAKEESGSSQNWLQTFGYDRYGNRTSFTQVVGSTTLPTNANTKPTIDISNNRFTAGQGYQYDLAGNVIADPDGRQFVFDGSNKQVEVKDASNNVIGTYHYDSGGKRIKKVTATEETVFVYAGGKLVAEYSTDIAPMASTKYVATDTLGSIRAISDQNGDIVSRRDFMPFGEEMYAGTPNRTSAQSFSTDGDDVRQKFTGYERDKETGLDFAEARYYKSEHARFTAVDPLLASGQSANPQTFNRYTYVLNNPMILTDPTGLQVADYTGSIHVRRDAAGVITNLAGAPFKGSDPEPYSGDPFNFPATDGFTYRVTSNGLSSIGETSVLQRADEFTQRQVAESNPFAGLPTFAMIRPVGRTTLFATQRWFAENNRRRVSPIGQRPPQRRLWIAEYFFPSPRRAGSRHYGHNSMSARAGSARNVNAPQLSNRTGRRDNCVNCSVAMDAILAGRPASALPGFPTPVNVLENIFNATFRRMGPESIRLELFEAGPGARGIVFGSRGPGVPGHVFNGVNQNGTVRFLDGQSGGPANWKGYTGFRFIRTN